MSIKEEEKILLAMMDYLVGCMDRMRIYHASRSNVLEEELTQGHQNVLTLKKKDLPLFKIAMNRRGVLKNDAIQDALSEIGSTIDSLLHSYVEIIGVYND